MLDKLWLCSNNVASQAEPDVRRFPICFWMLIGPFFYLGVPPLFRRPCWAKMKIWNAKEYSIKFSTFRQVWRNYIPKNLFHPSILLRCSLCDLIWREEGKTGKFVKNLYDWWVMLNHHLYVYQCRVVYIHLNAQVNMLLYNYTCLHIAEYTGGYDDIKIYRLA